MLGGGLLRGSSLPLTGAPGTADFSNSGQFVEAARARGEALLLVCFDDRDSLTDQGRWSPVTSRTTRCRPTPMRLERIGITSSTSGGASPNFDPLIEL